MNGRLEGKIAVITGGTSGIGLAAARLFAEQGAHVVATGSSAASVVAAREMVGSSSIDLVESRAESTTDVQALFADVGGRHGGFDVLFINAGIVRNGLLSDMADEVFDEVMRVNVKGAFLALKHGTPWLRAGGAVVVNTSVINQLGFAGGGAYAASKAALRSLVRTAAAELVERNVRVNAVSPGPTDTPVYHRQGLPPAVVPQVIAGLVAMVPQRRLAAAREIAQAALFLASAEASFITGAELAVDGGLGSL